MKRLSVKKLFYLYAFFDEFILIYPLYAVMFAERGLSAAQISALFITWSLTAFLLEVPSGAIADKYPRRTVLMLAQLLRGFAYLSWLMFPGFVGFMLGFVLWGVDSALSSGTREALVYDELNRISQPKDYTKVMGRMESLGILAVIVGGFVAGGFAGFGYTIVLLLSFVVCVVSAICIYALPKAPAVKSTGEVKYFDYLKEGIHLVLRNTKMLFIIGFVAIVTGLGAVDEYYSLFFKEQGFNNAAIAVLIGAICIFGVLGSAVAHKLEDKKVPLTLSVFVGACVLFASTLVPAILSPIVLGVYVGFFFLVKVLFNTYLQREATDKNRATITSVNGLMSEVGALIVFGTFAVVGQTRNYASGLQVIAVIMFVMGIAYGLLSRKYNSTHR